MGWKKELRDVVIVVMITFPVGFSISYFLDLIILFNIILTVVISFPIYSFIMYFVWRGDKLEKKPCNRVV